MGLLSDFFIATPEEVRRLDLHRSPADRLPGFQAKGIDPVKLAILESCVEGAPLEAHPESLEQMMVRDAGEDGPWVMKIPAHVMKGLAGATPQQLRQWAQGLAETEEWGFDSGAAKEASRVLKAVAKLAREAEAKGRRLYVWHSL